MMVGMRKLSYSTAFIVAILAQVPIGQAATISGTAVIVDGDTLWVGSQEIRIHGIDAPETSQRCQLPKGTWDCSAAVIEALASMADGKTVTCVGNEVDQYGRLIALCSTDEVPDIGAQLVASGQAWPSSSIRPTTPSSRKGHAPRSSASGNHRHSRLGNTAPGVGRLRNTSRSGPSWGISAGAISLAERPDRAIWVTSVRTRREDRTSISSRSLADLGGQPVSRPAQWSKRKPSPLQPSPTTPQ
jgi:endonuclease YncB( thermonuclease family)